MSPAFKHHSCTLFSAAAAVVLGLQLAPWPSMIQAQENAPAPLIVQAQARPITPVTKREQREFNNPQRPVQPTQQRSSSPQYGKSDVQKELEKLYEQNGREVPEMVDPKMSQPASGTNTQTPQTQMQPAPQSYQAAPVSAPKKKGLFSKLFGKKGEGPTQPPVEPPYTPTVSSPPLTPPSMGGGQPANPGTGLQNYGQLFHQPDTTPGSAVVQQQPPSQPPQQLPMVQPRVAQSNTPDITARQNQATNLGTPPASGAQDDTGFEAPLFVETPASTGATKLPAIDFNAPLAEPDVVDLGQPAPLTLVEKPAEPLDPFSDDALFPGAAPTAATKPAAVAELTVAADVKPVEQSPLVIEAAPVDENPYTGLTLDADPFSNPTTLKVTTAAPREISVDSHSGLEKTVEASPPALMIPLEDQGQAPRGITILPAQPRTVPAPESGSDEPPLVVDQEEVSPPSQLPLTPRIGNERTRAKQEMISARRGLRGLKGFCPVVLRDDRDLVDAHSQFRVAYNNKTYYLSSSQAVTAFHSDPAKYSPASRGYDVIHLAITGEELEGSLDYAVWYKGRLYLFSSAETMDTFVSAPSSHATLD